MTNNSAAGEWLTYAEAGMRLGITTAAARQLSRRRGWQRRTPNAYGVPATILVPEDALEKPLQVNADGGRKPNGVGDTSAAFDLLARQLEREQQRADRAEHQLDELRPQLEELRTALADAVGAERVAAGEAAGLRQEVDRLRGRPRWRRWFR